MPIPPRLLLPTAFAVMLALAGCTVGPDFVKPKAPVLEQWQQADQEEGDLRVRLQQPLQPGHGSPLRLRDRCRFEPSAQGQMQIHALDEPLGLHAHQGGSRTIGGNLLLLHAAQIAGAHFVADLGQLQRFSFSATARPSTDSRRAAANSADSASSTSPNARAPNFLRPRLALLEFAHWYNTHWLVARHGCRTPAQIRADQQPAMEQAA